MTKRALFLFLAAILVSGVSSCGGGGSSATQIEGAAPQQTPATVVITASSGTQTQSLAITLSQ